MNTTGNHVIQILSIWLCLLSTGIAIAQTGQKDVLMSKPIATVDKVRPGDSFKVGVQVTLQGDWHINSNQPHDEFLIPTTVVIDSAEALTVDEMHYPSAKDLKLAFSETDLSVYEGDFLIWTTINLSDTLPPGEISITGTFRYQACNEMTCLLPVTQPFKISLPVAAAGTPVQSMNQKRFTEAAGEIGALSGDRSGDGSDIGALISDSGLFVTLGFIFLGGLALNLTPCVYPIIPITISFFVGQSSGNMARSFSLAFVYVLGMSVTYSALGVVAAMTGGLLGASLQNPAVLISIAAVFLIFSVSMFGAFEIRVPALLNKMAGGSRQGMAGSLLMGLTVGIVAAPCIGPFVLSLLTYVAAKGDPLSGFLLFFVLSLGLGLPFLLLGTFSGTVKNLPRSGEWMIWVKKVFGVIMIALAIYFVSPLLPEAGYIASFSLSLVAGGILVGFIDKSGASFSWFPVLKRTVGITLIAYGTWTAAGAWLSANAPRIDWQAYDDALIAEAAGMPVLIDFYADWCIPCKKIDKEIFGAEQVVLASENVLALQADLTKESSSEVVRLRKRYNVRGVPTIILLDRAGREYRRFTDELVEMAPAEFADLLSGLKKQAHRTIEGEM